MCQWRQMYHAVLSALGGPVWVRACQLGSVIFLQEFGRVRRQTKGDVWGWRRLGPKQSLVAVVRLLLP